MILDSISIVLDCNDLSGGCHVHRNVPRGSICACSKHKTMVIYRCELHVSKHSKIEASHVHTDSDGDGTKDCLDGCPTNPTKTNTGSGPCIDDITDPPSAIPPTAVDPPEATEPPTTLEPPAATDPPVAVAPMGEDMMGPGYGEYVSLGYGF